MREHERHELGAFLRARRARITPEAAGLPPGQRRKTPGLRREELAALAGISVTWYTWIEQGRNVNISPAVIDSLARVLQLGAHERAYLTALALSDTAAVPVALTAVSASIQQILDHQATWPAYVMGPFWDILGWNRAAAALFGDWAALVPPERNMIWYTFVRQEARTLVVDWPTRAKRLLAEFRADSSRHLTDPALNQFLQRLRGVSPEFAQWWEQHEIQPRDGGRREFMHPVAGHLVLEQTTLVVSNQPDLKLVLHMPLDGTAERLNLLIATEG